jgi:hypothetical protein
MVIQALKEHTEYRMTFGGRRQVSLAIQSTYGETGGYQPTLWCRATLPPLAEPMYGICIETGAYTTSDGGGLMLPIEVKFDNRMAVYRTMLTGAGVYAAPETIQTTLQTVWFRVGSQETLDMMWTLFADDIQYDELEFAGLLISKSFRTNDPEFLAGLLRSGEPPSLHEVGQVAIGITGYPVFHSLSVVDRLRFAETHDTREFDMHNGRNVTLENMLTYLRHHGHAFEDISLNIP